MLTIYNKTEDFTNLIVIFIAMYEIMEVIVYAFNFDFSSFATNIMDVYADNRNMYFKAVVALYICLLYTSDAADDLLCVDLGGRAIIKKKKAKSYAVFYLKTI